MNIEFERTMDDWVDFHLFHMENSPISKRQIFVAQLAIALLVTLLPLVILYFIFHNINTFMVVASLIGGILFFLLFPRLNKKSSIRSIQKTLNEGNNKAMMGHQIMTLSPDGIFSRNQAGESKINWSAITKIAQSDKHIFLYISAVSAYVIPKRCFHSEEEQKEFLQYVSTYCN